MGKENNKLGISGSQALELAGKKYKTSDLSDSVKSLIRSLEQLNAASDEKVNMLALLHKAKAAYISELKSEMLTARSGFDFSK